MHKFDGVFLVEWILVSVLELFDVLHLVL